VGFPESGYFKESPKTAAPHAISFWPELSLQEQAAFFLQGL
jgi:hypothetical protein